MVVKKRINEIMEKFKDKKVLGAYGNAMFFGQESRGITQIRGNGVLVLTETELYFEMWFPKRILQIPFNSIQRIETPKSHLGKTRNKKLLKVVFINESGEIDSVAWFIRKRVEEWVVALEKIIQNINRYLKE